jgi:pseudouridine kinase
MNAYKTVVIGGANQDITATSSKPLIAGDSNPGVIKNSAGGVGRNIAEDLVKLGNETSLITMLGDDSAAKVVIDSCERAQIDTSHMLVSDQWPTGTYSAIYDPQGQLALAVSDMSIIDHLLPEQLQSKKAALDNALEVVIEANLPETTIKWIAENTKGTPLHADAVSVAKAHRLRPILDRLDILKVNRQEAAAILEWTGDNMAMAEALYKLGVNKVLLSLGAQGAIFYSIAGPIEQKPMSTKICSDNGGGDALFAAMIAAQQLLKCGSHHLQFAMGCASFTLNCASAVNPKLSVEVIKQQYLTHLPPGAWYL